MILLLWVAPALGHGGPPQSKSLLWDASGQMTVASSHGLIFEDGDWDWVCDEVTGTSLPIDVVRSPQALVLGTTSGLAWSESGCDWTWNPELMGEVSGTWSWISAIPSGCGRRQEPVCGGRTITGPASHSMAHPIPRHRFVPSWPCPQAGSPCSAFSRASPPRG
jgi:hypothetical protein